MKKLWRVLPSLVFALAICASGKALQGWAADTQSLSAQEPEVKTVQGALIKVDLESQTLTVKLENEEEIQFQYNSDTKVEGRENGIQGLASETGTQLTITYTEDSGKRLASKIVIKKSDG